jgi:hypothetical protein
MPLGLRLLAWLIGPPRLFRVRGDKLFLLGDDFGDDPAALRERLVARHLRTLPPALRDAYATGSHPALAPERIAEARAHAGDLLREIAHLSYVNDVIPTFRPSGIQLSVVLRTPYLPPDLREQVPWLYRGFETRCLPRPEP